MRYIFLLLISVFLPVHAQAAICWSSNNYPTSCFSNGIAALVAQYGESRRSDFEKRCDMSPPSDLPSRKTVTCYLQSGAYHVYFNNCDKPNAANSMVCGALPQCSSSQFYNPVTSKCECTNPGYGGENCDVFEQCPPGHKRHPFTQTCYTNEESPTGCYKTTIFSTLAGTQVLQEHAVCDDDPPTGPEDPPLLDDGNGCTINNNNYAGHKNGKPICSGNGLEDCKKPFTGKVGGQWVTVCGSNRDDFNRFDDDIKRCSLGYISIDGKCEKIGHVDKQESTETFFNPDGSYREVTKVTETHYKADGTVVIDQYDVVQEFGADHEPIGPPTKENEKREEKKGNDNKGAASGNCNAPPACSGDGIQCAILKQNWHTMCQAKQIADLLAQQNNQPDQPQGSGSVSGGSDCSSAPQCNNDALFNSAVECAILLQTWYSRCEKPATGDNDDGTGEGNGEGEGDDEGNPSEFTGYDFGNDAETSLQAAQGEYDQLLTTIKGEIDTFFDFDISGSADSTLECNPIEIRGVEVDFSLCRFQEQLSIIGYIFIAVASLLAFIIIMG